MKDIFERARRASRVLTGMGVCGRNAAIIAVADELEAGAAGLLEANASDLSAMDPSNALYDRLKLTADRIADIARGMREVAALPDPLGRVLEDRTLPNGLRLRKVSVPFGVIGVVYEARPNVTFDVFSLCFKSGSACLLKGGRDADATDREAIRLIKSGLAKAGADPDIANLLPSTHEAADALLGATGYVDLVIPRGGRSLIDFVRDNSRVPYIETGAGVVHAYFDEAGDLSKGIPVITNAKIRRVSVCNALDCLLVHSSRLSDLPALCSLLAGKDVEILADERSFAALEGFYPAGLLKRSRPEDYGTEFMAYRMAVKTVDSRCEAVAHIGEYGSGHSESIVTEDEATAEMFRRDVDAACVYVNAPTSFTDGAQFGLGAEIGISTQKLGARGPMGLDEITTYKWLVDGEGQTRP